MSRIDGRELFESRKCTIQPGFVETAAGSCLISTGKTRVICTASVDESVPAWMKGTGRGWITAEYAMLPASTGKRKQRDGIKKDGRSVEIQRLIGRALRQAVDLTMLGERMITIDCDVLTADGGTRTASITGGFVALVQAINKLIKDGILNENPIVSQVAAISVGMIEGSPMLDLCYAEDSNAQTDMNLVMNERSEFIELQGTGEEKPFTAKQLHRLLGLGAAGIRKLMCVQRDSLNGCGSELLPKPVIVVATGNAHKLSELSAIFNNRYKLISMKDAGFDEEIFEDGSTFEQNALIKAETVSQALGMPVLADDSGISVDVLDGAPGIFSARYAGEHGNDTENNALLLENMKDAEDRTCRFVCAMALALPGEDTAVVRGECIGTLATEYHGNDGFGYDPLFLLDNGLSFAEISRELKNEISHRAVASKKMTVILDEAF